MSKTPLYEIHKDSGAKIVDFAGWQMPVMYEGIRQEHLAVRNDAGIFDVSHMGEIEITGKDAKKYCQILTTNNLNKIKDNKAQYTLLCNDEGGVVDDVIIYKFSDDKFFFCVNASNTDKVYNWMISNSDGYDLEIANVSSDFGQIAVQGPNAIKILDSGFGLEFDKIKRFSFDIFKFNSEDIIAARTGYTGEDGFELFIPKSQTLDVWKSIVNSGENYNLKLCGLGARDTLRVEMGYPLYGHEIEMDINPLEAGLARYIKLDENFIGRDVLVASQDDGLKRNLYGIEMVDRGIPRSGYKVFYNDLEVGYVTSGTLSPSLQKSIGLCLIDAKDYSSGNLFVEMRGQLREAKFSEIPFYKNQN